MIPDFIIWIVNRRNDLKTRCFDDFANSLKCALIRLGFSAVLEHESGFVVTAGSPILQTSRLVVLGLSDINIDFDLPCDSIIYNTEQVLIGNHWSNLFKFRSNIFWDYSKSNLLWFSENGIKCVHCPVGFISGCNEISIKQNAVEKIDVLFYGWLNSRRKLILDKLSETGLNTKCLIGVYGDERDFLISQSKVVLNLHYYTPAVFEMFRVGHLLSNSKCVVSENGGIDLELERFASEAVRLVSYDKVVDECVEMCANVSLRNSVAERGKALFKKLDFVDHVRQALVESGVV